MCWCRAPSKPMTVSQKTRTTTRSSCSLSDETSETDDASEESHTSDDDDDDDDNAATATVGLSPHAPVTPRQVCLKMQQELDLYWCAESTAMLLNSWIFIDSHAAQCSVSVLNFNLQSAVAYLGEKAAFLDFLKNGLSPDQKAMHLINLKTRTKNIN